jgi:hypothetical protein
MNRDTIVKFHEETAACWRAKNQPVFADAHDDRVKALDAGAALTEHESAGDTYGMMLDAVSASRDVPAPVLPTHAPDSPRGVLLTRCQELRAAQVAYMADRGNETLGAAVGAAGVALDEAIAAVQLAERSA